MSKTTPSQSFPYRLNQITKLLITTLVIFFTLFVTNSVQGITLTDYCFFRTLFQDSEFCITVCLKRKSNPITLLLKTLQQFPLSSQKLISAHAIQGFHD